MMPDKRTKSKNPDQLHRQVGVLGGTLMGLGSILGTGVFVSIAIATEATGPSIVGAIGLASIVAACNGLSSAQLAANHPVSGGTYEYGYRWLNAPLGFTAGWMFLCAKSASAATAALGFGGYLLNLFLTDLSGWLIFIAVALIAIVTILVISGIRRSNLVNGVMVLTTIAVLLVYIAVLAPTAWEQWSNNLSDWFAPSDPMRWRVGGFLEATALMFVAYTGYGRIATLGEEIHDPRKNIPIAIIVTLGVSMMLYLLVGLVSVAAVGAENFVGDLSEPVSPLESVARQTQHPVLGWLIAIGALTAMFGVLLNLILGLSRVILAMARRDDLPRPLSNLSQRNAQPVAATACVGLIVALLALTGNVKTTWSFSAFTVLIYYSLTNLAAIRLSRSERLYPQWISWLGLGCCLMLAFWVKPTIWIVGLGLILLGLAWHWFAQQMKRFR